MKNNAITETVYPILQDAIEGWNQRAENTCEGCAYDDPATHFAYCSGCSRDVLLEDKWVSPQKVVESEVEQEEN